MPTPARRLVGIRVERRTITFPDSIPASDVLCEVDPELCCICCNKIELGSVLFAEVLIGSDTGTGTVGTGTLQLGCDCIPLCILLIYNADRDAWLSDDLGPACGWNHAIYMRLRCDYLTGTWVIDFLVIANEGEEAEQESVSTGERVFIICEPMANFTVRYEFLDPELVCDGRITVTVSADTCLGTGTGTGTGTGGETVEVGCCEGDPIPTTLYATFNEGEFGPAVLTYNGVDAWIGELELTGACSGTLSITLTCEIASWILNLNCGGSGVDTGPSTISCSPFQLEWLFVPTGCSAPCSSLSAVITE